VDFDAMLQAYYAARDWDPLSGAPSAGKLEQLGLGWTMANIHAPDEIDEGGPR
jgi:hypothetical protein